MPAHWQTVRVFIVLDLCPQQIDACRPFFLGILGERYGYVSSRLPDRVASSVRQPFQADPLTTKESQPGKADVHLDASKYGGIRHHTGKSITVIPYSCEYGGLKTNGDVQLKGLDEFGRQIAEWLGPAIKAELKLPIQNQPGQPAPTETDPLAEEHDFHERLMESRLRVYVGRRTSRVDAIRLMSRPTCMGDSRSCNRRTSPTMTIGRSFTGRDEIPRICSHGGRWPDKL